ncbi:hypothetical protein SDC9_120925 [bioreactor metagenome]|uniref:Uncharacterized protein n=1 Tax=bioreactor metagenome TaxID=1076179 RepID=A0A645CAI8_9ZZZZ
MPANTDVKSNDTSRFSLNSKGTSPMAMRCASPSAIAVFPTPGSPIKTGLFLVFRLRMRITSLISPSRPITGSSFCFCAKATRSLAYLLSASYVSSGLSPVTRAAPRTVLSAVKKSCSLIVKRLNRAFTIRSGDDIRPMKRCSTERYSSFILSAILPASCMALSISWDI